jgi:hypothetical protein
MEERNRQAVDAEGTSEQQGREIIRRLRDEGFDGDDERLAVALGRPVEHVQSWTGEGAEPVDDDIVMKARGIAKERGLEIE